MTDETRAPLPESGTNNAAGPDSAWMGSSSVLPTEAGTCARNEIAPPVSAPAAPTGETPRTDAAIAAFQRRTYTGVCVCVDAEDMAKVERELAEARREFAEIRDALAGTDYASLPSDFPTVRMAHTIRADHDKFRQQVIDTCARAEKAEAELAASRSATGSNVTPHEWQRLVEVAREEGRIAGRNEALRERLDTLSTRQARSDA